MNGLILTFSEPVAGAEAEYDDWYQNVHLRQICQIPGVLSAQRFRLVDPAAAKPGEARNVAVYQLDGDPREVLAEMAARARNGELDHSAALDLSTVSVTMWYPNGSSVSA